jgi:hypothetical protein
MAHDLLFCALLLLSLLNVENLMVQNLSADPTVNVSPPEPLALSFSDLEQFQVSQRPQPFLCFCELLSFKPRLHSR